MIRYIKIRIVLWVTIALIVYGLFSVSKNERMENKDKKLIEEISSALIEGRRTTIIQEIKIEVDEVYRESILEDLKSGISDISKQETFFGFIYYVVETQNNKNIVFEMNKSFDEVSGIKIYK